MSISLEVIFHVEARDANHNSNTKLSSVSKFARVMKHFSICVLGVVNFYGPNVISQLCSQQGGDEDGKENRQEAKGEEMIRRQRSRRKEQR